MKIFIERHDGSFKRFQMTIPPISVRVDYDDVDHPQVDAAVETIKKVLEEHWDEEFFQKKFKEEIMKVWNKNDYDLQSDYEGGLEEYLENYGLSIKDAEN
jgi:hypothetical protein